MYAQSALITILGRFQFSCLRVLMKPILCNTLNNPTVITEKN